MEVKVLASSNTVVVVQTDELPTLQIVSTELLNTATIQQPQSISELEIIAVAGQSVTV